MNTAKPYTVTTYKLLDRKTKPPTVAPGGTPTEHKTEGAARKEAKARADGCLFDGPKNIAVARGPDGFEEVWFMGSASSQRGRDINLRLKAFLHRGGFVVVEPGAAGGAA